ncbi:MAG: lipoprotein, partial [Bacteroidota bacterium]
MQKLLFTFLLALILTSCNQGGTSEKLPILGNTIYEENDTIYHTIADFQLVDQDSSLVTNTTFENKVYVADFF